MAATLSLAESSVLIVLRNFLLDILPSGVEVVRGQVNRTPEPDVDDFVVMTTIMRTRLSTNTDQYSDSTGTRTATAPTELTVQLDFHGDHSGDNVQIVTTLFRDEYACDFFDEAVLNGSLVTNTGFNITDQFGNTLGATANFSVAPLYTSDPRQIPFINGELQYEYRWSVDVAIQISAQVTIPQDFATSVNVTLTEVETINIP